MLKIDHRGFDPLPDALFSVYLDASLRSNLVWNNVCVDHPHVLWELDFNIQGLSPSALASYQLAVGVFIEKIWEKHQENTVGVVLYKGRMPAFDIESFADYLHQIGSALPEEVPPFALFHCPGDPLFFSKEIFPYIHLGFASGRGGVLRWEGAALIPHHLEATVGVVLPLREKGLQFDLVDQCLGCLDQSNKEYLLIAEPYLNQEWDGLNQVIFFPTLASDHCLRAIHGFEAAGGEVIRFGVEGFEPPTFCSQSRRASQTALYPEIKL